MPLPLASSSQLGTWLGQPIDDGARAEAVLAGASALVRAEAGRSWMNDADDALVDVPAEVSTVVIQCAARVWVNPQGLVSSPAGEQGSRQWASSAANGLYLTDAEKAIIARYKATGGLSTIGTYRGDLGCDGTIYVPVEGSENPFPWYSGCIW